MLESGNKRRTQHPTEANATSSRSHAVFQVRKRRRGVAENEGIVIFSFLAGFCQPETTYCCPNNSSHTG